MVEVSGDVLVVVIDVLEVRDVVRVGAVREQCTASWKQLKNQKSNANLYSAVYRRGIKGASPTSNEFAELLKKYSSPSRAFAELNLTICRSFLSSGRNVRWPRHMLSPGESRCLPTGQTERRTPE